MDRGALQLMRTFSSNSLQSLFITTPIYYVNASPHIGHLYSSVIADATARWYRLSSKGAKIKFSTGTDEHGTKIQQAAAAHNTNPVDYCGLISDRYRHLAREFSISHTDFIRTSDPIHKETVQKFWNELSKRGHIYSSKYAGWYCISDETFLTDSQLKEKVEPDGRKTIVSGESGHPVEWTEEVNYMFPLGSFQDDLRYWIKATEERVRPSKFQKILLDMVEELPDISISRPSARVHWGVPVPQDATQTVYVWLDALVSYLTAAGYSQDQEAFARTWPPTVHIIGKDILKFHGIYWPAFLIAAGLEPPRSLLCHSHWTVDAEKMSKSKGNVVCPLDRSVQYTSDGMRYFLLREGVAHSDGNYSDTKVLRILNSELADTLGNLLSRCSGRALNPQRTFPAIEPLVLQQLLKLDVGNKLLVDVERLSEICSEHYSHYNFYKAVDSIIATLHQANLFFETLKPWELKKHSKQAELDAVIHLTLETLRICAILLQPIVPNLSGNLLDSISVPPEQRSIDEASTFSWKDPNFKSRHLSPDQSVLFKRIIVESEEKKKTKSKSS